MIIAPIVSLVFMVIGSSFFMSFTSLFFKSQNLGGFQVGLVQSLFYLGLLFSTFYAERFISRVGHIRALTALSGLLCALTLILSFVSINHWYFFRVLAGACVGCFYVGVESWILAESTPQTRGVALAIYTMSMYLGQSMSQLFLNYGHNNSASAFTIASFFFSLAVIPVSVSKKLGPVVHVSEPESIVKFLKLSPLSMIGCLISGLILSTLYTYMPIYFHSYNLNAGKFMAILVLGGGILQVPFGKISDKMERRFVLTLFALLGGICSLLLSFVPPSSGMYLIFFVLGGILFTVYPVSMALASDVVSQDDLLKMTGVMLFAYGIGAVVGPVLTPIFKFYGKSFMLFSVAFYNFILFGIGLYVIKIKKKVGVDNQSLFSALPLGPIIERLNPFRFRKK